MSVTKLYLVPSIATAGRYRYNSYDVGNQTNAKGCCRYQKASSSRIFVNVRTRQGDGSGIIVGWYKDYGECAGVMHDSGMKRCAASEQTDSRVVRCFRAIMVFKIKAS